MWAGTGGAAPGPRLSELIDARVGTVSTEEQAALEILAVGEPLGTDLLAEMTSRAVLSELEREGWSWSRPPTAGGTSAWPIRSTPSGSPAASASSGGRRSAATSPTSSRAGALRADDAFRVAAWRLDGGGPIDPEVARRRRSPGVGPARPCSWPSGWPAAAADAGGGHAAIVELGNALYWQGRHEDVLDLLADVDLAGRSGPATGRRRRSSRHRPCSSGWATAPGADAVLREAEAAIDDPSWRRTSPAHRAGLLVYGGQIEEGLALARAVLDDPEAGDRARGPGVGARPDGDGADHRAGGCGTGGG